MVEGSSFSEIRFFRNPQTHSLAWRPEEQLLYFLNYKNNVANIFRVVVTGNQPLGQVTYYTSGEIFDFAVTPDGKRIAIARGSVSSDIIIFKSVN